MGFLTIKELNCRQVKWAEILVEYYFKIKYVKGTDNTRVDTFNKKAELQSSEKLLDIILRINKNRKIKYNHLKLAAIHKAFILNQETKIRKAQNKDLKYKNYKY